MLRKFKKHLSYANVMASLAMFAVLGGGAFAAVKLKKDSVGSKQLKTNAVKTAELADGAVTTPKLADNAATGAKVDESSLGQVPSAASADSATNATNATSAQNATQAADSTLFSGRSLAQVRGRGDGQTGPASTNGLPAASFESVITEDTQIPSGGASLVVTAAVTASASGADGSLTCELRDDDGAISQQMIDSITVGTFETQSLVAVKEYPTGTGLANPQDISVFCKGSGVDDRIRFERGDLGFVVSPIGS
jgi:hypothetical protein